MIVEQLGKPKEKLHGENPTSAKVHQNILLKTVLQNSIQIKVGGQSLKHS